MVASAHQTGSGRIYEAKGREARGRENSVGTRLHGCGTLIYRLEGAQASGRREEELGEHH